jgi:signal recognition particle subunit SRP72
MGRAWHADDDQTYRAEKFDRAAQLYKELNQTPTEVENEANDLTINAGAVDAQLEWAGLGHLAEKKKPTREDMEAFETAYNAACGSIARGELGQGEVLLKRAKGKTELQNAIMEADELMGFADLCNALDDMTEDEKKNELLPIIVQQIYLLGRLGRLEEAEQLCAGINISEYELRVAPTMRILEADQSKDFRSSSQANCSSKCIGIDSWIIQPVPYPPNIPFLTERHRTRRTFRSPVIHSTTRLLRD